MSSGSGLNSGSTVTTPNPGSAGNRSAGVVGGTSASSIRNGLKVNNGAGTGNTKANPAENNAPFGSGFRDPKSVNVTQPGGGTTNGSSSSHGTGGTGVSSHNNGTQVSPGSGGTGSTRIGGTGSTRPTPSSTPTPTRSSSSGTNPHSGGGSTSKSPSGTNPHSGSGSGSSGKSGDSSSKDKKGKN